MMEKGLQLNTRLLYKHEVLRARLSIRDFFLKNTVREIYENIGQVLSLVRMQLAVTVFDSTGDKDQVSHAAAEMVGQTIRELRAMCKSFYPDTDILEDEGFDEALVSTIAILFINAKPAIEIKGERKEMQPDLRLIVFKMIQEILVAIKEAQGEFIKLVISYTKKAIKFVLNYSGTIEMLNQIFISNVTDIDLTLHERAKLIEGRLSITRTKAGINQINLISPLKSFYE